jgi:hypothetical protein
MNDRGGIYFDTSALAKWYLNEARSEDVERYLQERAPVLISDLTAVEFRCLLARRRRNGELDFALENRIFSTFQEDIRLGHLRCSPVPEPDIRPVPDSDALLRALPRLKERLQNWAYFQDIEPRLYRYPAVNPSTFRRRVQDLLTGIA